MFADNKITDIVTTLKKRFFPRTKACVDSLYQIKIFIIIQV